MHRKAHTGNNLNTITNQQWEILNEYAPAAHAPKPSYNDNSNVLHLELSEDSQISNTDDDETTDRQSTTSSEPMKKTLRKALILDNETDDTDTDYDKENTTIFPNLSEMKKQKKICKNGLKNDRLYPNLSNYELSEAYKEATNFRIDQDEPGYSETMSETDQMSGLPFISTTRANRGLMNAFFSEEQVTDDYMHMLEEDTKSKIAGLVQKPQQFGLMKRGLGGMTNEELQESRITYKKEPHQIQTKPAKITAMSLTLADVQQRIGTKNLKPKLMTKYAKQQPKKLGFTKLNQTLVGTNVEENNQLRTLKLNEMKKEGEAELKYVKLSESIVNNMEMCVADAALFQSRRFKVNWSMNPSAAAFSSLCLNGKSTDLTMVNIDKVSPF